MRRRAGQISRARWKFPTSSVHTPALKSAGAFRALADGIFSAFFPDDCRLCEGPLIEASRVPVCALCLDAVEGWDDAVRCALCQRELLHAAGLDERGACGVCRRKPQILDRVWTYGPYAGNLRQVIHLLKYNGMRPLAQLLGERCSSQMDIAQQADLVVPTPLHWSKRLKRGFNQSLLLAQAVARRQAVPCAPHALSRRRATPPQAGLSGVQRRESLRGAFSAKRELVEGKRILLVDDVVTTGATLEACAKALRRAGAVRVTAMTAARAQLARRAL